MKIGKDEVKVDPLLLFQRLMAVGSSLTDDTSSLFKYELCTVPPALFELTGLMRRADKSTRAKSLLNMLDDTNLELSHNVEYVLEGGALLQRLPWKRVMTYSAICDLYVDYVKPNYKNAVVVFDGYECGRSTKDTAHLRRTGGCTSTPVKFTEDMTLTLKKDLFLKHKANKQAFIKMLDKKLQSTGFRGVHADDDANVLIVRKATEVSQTANTAVIGDDTNLLVLLLFHARNIKSFSIFFHPEHKQFARKKPITVNIHSAVRNLGMEPCENILFIHALFGCDTVFSVLGIGKGASLKAYNQSRYFREQAHVFAKSGVIIETISEQITSAGEKVLLHLYKRTYDDNLDTLRYRVFCQKVASSRFLIKQEVLLPTSAAAKYHSFRVFHQVKLWTGETLVRLNGDGGSRMNRCNQRRQILDVCQVSCITNSF